MRVEVTPDESAKAEHAAEFWIEDVPAERPEILFGRRLRELRTQAEWSQTEVAARVTAQGRRQFHQTAIAKIEAGTRPLRLDEAFEIAAVFRLEPWEFFKIATGDLLKSDVPDLSERAARLEELLAAADAEVDSARTEERAALKKRSIFRQELEAVRERLETQQEDFGGEHR